ncbi:hypothetical protein KUTeg_005595 [Tegillarca granosa]|uniref:Macro domain-containing protein n=1 Tax=Tegillarca granosa TaxID=220873 RepID=A0ABQ9FK72_TEGGR|nr:hypothetical protein KUTeg_005595 [Tegillarca granosa]
MKDCLTEAENSGYTSITFLALGTGDLGYPVTDVADLMYKCILDTERFNDGCKIKHIGFVVHDKNRDTLQLNTKLYRIFCYIYFCINKSFILLQCDVIVCGTSKELNLSAGKSCKNLLQFGGKKLQDECKKKYPEGIKEGEIAVVKGCGNLKCKEVYFGALPDWKTEQSKHRKMLWKFVESCMLKAHESGHSTIVFAALGTGALGYPPDRAAHLMYDSVIKFDNSHDTRSALKNVKFVVHYKDDQTIRVDVIACNVSPTLNLRNGKVTHALLTCEQSLQSECQQNYPYGINIGELAVIGPGNLPCKKVYLGVLPKYEEDEENSEQVYTDIAMYR